VDDEEDVLLTMRTLLKRAGYSVSVATNGLDALEAMRKTPYPLVITDLRMPQMGGEELLAKIVEEFPDSEVMVLTGYGTVESAVEAMKKGAADYLTKPCDPDEMLVRVERILKAKRMEQENQRLREQLAREAGRKKILGESPQIREVLTLIDKVAAVDSTVLIQGESGVGKELVAHPLQKCPPPWPVYQGELRGHPGKPVGGGAVRPRERGLHRRPRGAGRPL